MAEASDIVHLVVEVGPDADRRITVPTAGARIGRSSQNDIELTDPSISRFQCRVYFKPDGLLWIADLGSTNETLVNGKALLEAKLNVGDTIEIGESVIRVVCDNLAGTPPADAPVPAAPQPVAQPAVAATGGAVPPPLPLPLPLPPLPPAGEAVSPKIDLGLDRDNRMGGEESPERAAGAKNLMWLVFVLGAAVAIIVLMKSGLIKPKSGVGGNMAAAGDSFSIYYEKVQGSVSNIFRYELTLENNLLYVRIDSLTENRHVTRDKLVAKEVLEKLSSDIARSEFFKLDPSYQGLQPGVYESADLDITIGQQNRHSAVLNRLEPEAFKNTRELIEEFAKNELGLITISLSPQKLTDLSRDACLLGQKLYGEREVKYQNLWLSIRAFDEALLYLETIDPKPDFHPTIISGLADSKAELKTQHAHYVFLADKAIRMSDWQVAADNLRIIKEMIPDRNDPRNTDADKKLVDVERRLKR